MARTHLTFADVRVPTKRQRANDILAKFTDFDGALDNVENNGTIPSARLNMATVPTANDTVVIGGHTFKFVAALGAVVAQTQVKILGTAALQRAALINAINGVVDANVVKGTVPFAGKVVADEIDTTRVRVRYSLTTGGAAVAADKADVNANIAVSETLTAAADVWDRTNLNLTGKAAKSKFAMSSIAITAEMITATKAYVEFGFTPIEVLWTAHSAAGVLLAASSAVSIEGNAVKILLPGGVAPQLQATDVVTIYVAG